MKNKQKNEAIELRKRGFSYSEILKNVPVAKSTLSLWLRSVGLSKKQKQRLTSKKLLSIKKGWLARKQQRINKTNYLKNKAINDINKLHINKDNLWLMGIMLYWAEGSKEKEHLTSQVIFSNSNPYMIKLFLKWLNECVYIYENEINIQLYIHENHKKRIAGIIKYWSLTTGFSLKKFDKIYYKKHNPNTLRKNILNNYYGQIRIIVKKSTDLNRTISGWIQGICNQCGVV